MNLIEASTRSGRSRRSLYIWIAKGELPFTRVCGSIHVKLPDVLRLIPVKDQLARHGRDDGRARRWAKKRTGSAGPFPTTGVGRFL